MIQTIGLAALLLVSAQNPKPPKTEYNKVRDETTWSTGDVAFRRGSSFAYWAGFHFSGKEPKAPTTVRLSFGTVRRIETNDQRSDADYAEWANVKNIVLRWGEKPVEIEAKYLKTTISDDFAKAFGYRTFGEILYADIPVAQYHEIASAKELLVQLGRHTDTINEKTLSNARKLSEAIKLLK